MVKKLYVIAVAPHTGAWIETNRYPVAALRTRSLPIRERGLKLYDKEGFITFKESLPIRERGLKLSLPESSLIPA